MKIKPNELSGAALDWAVGYAQCMDATGGKSILSRDLMSKAICNGMASPSTDRAQGDQIIEREKICLYPDCPVGPKATLTPDVQQPHFYFVAYGPTPLIAAMRCYVASKLGDEIEVPEEVR